MAEKRPSGFRFRLPWLLQPTLTSRPAIAPESPRTTTQTSVASTAAQRPPFRPPGIAPAPVAPPPTLTTPPPPPVSPTRAQPRSASLQASVASSPPPVPEKSSAPRSAIAKNLDPVAGDIPLAAARTADDGETQPTKEAQVTTDMASPVTPPAMVKVAATIETQTTPAVPLAAARTANAGETQPAKETQAATTPQAIDRVADTNETQTTSETPGPPVPLVAARTAEDGETQPAKETQTATEIASPEAPPAVDKVVATIETQTTRDNPAPAVLLVAVGTAEDDETQAATEMASSTTLPAIAKVGNAAETQPTKELVTTTGPKPTTETPAPATTPQRPQLRPPSPINIQPLQTDTSPKSSSGLASQPTDKPSLSPSITAAAVPHNTPEIKRSTDLDDVPQGVDLALDAKTKEIAKGKGTQTKSLNPHSTDKITETKSQKPRPMASAPLSLHNEMKDDIYKFIRKMATNPSKRYTDEKPASVVTVAGDNTGASMHLGSDVIGYKVNSDRSARDATINGEGSSNGKKWRKDSKSSEHEATKAIVNSNIQGINNSMMFNSSVTERNPGVHIGFSINLANDKDSKMKNRESMETHRAEANTTPQQTLVYDPTIRRCIEGVSMEANDLDKAAKVYEVEIV